MKISSTLSAIRAFPRFCKMFSESSTVVMQRPCCPGKQGELSENCLQNLRNDLMVESVNVDKGGGGGQKVFKVSGCLISMVPQQTPHRLKNCKLRLDTKKAMTLVVSGGENRSESPPTAAAPAFYYGMTSDGQQTGTGGSSSSVIDTPIRQVRSSVKHSLYERLRDPASALTLTGDASSRNHS